MRVLALLIFLVTSVAGIWPLPKSYQTGQTVLWIDQSVQIVRTQGYKSTSPQSVNNQQRSVGEDTTSFSDLVIQNAIQRTKQILFSESYIPWKFYPRHSNFEPSTSAKKYISIISLIQTQEDPPTAPKPLDGKLNESYQLTMSEDGQTVITAPTSIGLAHGLTSLTQLFFAHSQDEGIYTRLAPVKIVDGPLFPHRGLNLDVSRNYYPVSIIQRTIDGLAYNKMNRLHLHITDAQSWPLVIPSMPELSEKGSYRAGLVYTPTQLQQLQEYGSIRGVEVYIETDMPGHTSSIWFAYPELIAAFNIYPNWQVYAEEPPSGTLKLNSSAVYDFLGKLWKDILPRVYPYTSYYHMGGDELNYNSYLLDDTVKSNSSRVITPLLQKFYEFNRERVIQAGLTPIVWQEMLLSYNLTLNHDTVVQTWESDEAVARTVKQGFKALAGNYNYWYLDCGQGQWLDFEIGNSSRIYWPYADYCSPRHNWRLMYSYDPLQGVPAEYTHLVLGGEVHMWSEQTDEHNLGRQLWPRVSAAGEILWSGAKDASGRNRSQIDASPRLADMRERMVAQGFAAEPVQMPFCTQNGTQCAILNKYA